VTLGYEPEGDLGVPQRESFRAPHLLGLPTHHLYVVPEGSKPLLDHILFRDALRQEPQQRLRYASLKRENAKASGDNLEQYTALKAAFVSELLARARELRGLPPVDYWQPSAEELLGLPQR
jgi:GrpB-like predicted nucleotidyltransferase (UPF0157 family)